MRLIKTAVNTAALTFAFTQIAAGAVDKTSPWAFDGNDADKIKSLDASNEKSWYLGGDSAYPIGKNGKVYRNALIAVRQKAAQMDDEEIYRAAGSVIDRIDGKNFDIRMKRGPAMKQRAWAKFELKSAVDEEDDSDKRIITGTATTPNPDRMQDVVEPKGAEYDLPIPYLWQHNSDEPIGNVINAKVSAKGIDITAEIAKISKPGTLKDRIDEAWQSIKSKLVRGQSIGFAPLEFNYMSDTGGFHFVRWAWLELSAVTIPANADASIANIKRFDLATIKRNATRPIVKLGKSSRVIDTLTPAERKKFGQAMCDSNSESVDEILAERERMFNS